MGGKEKKERKRERKNGNEIGSGDVLYLNRTAERRNGNRVVERMKDDEML